MKKTKKSTIQKQLNGTKKRLEKISKARKGKGKSLIDTFALSLLILENQLAIMQKLESLE